MKIFLAKIFLTKIFLAKIFLTKIFLGKGLHFPSHAHALLYPPPTYNSHPCYLKLRGGGRNKRTHGPDGAMVVPFIYIDCLYHFHRYHSHLITLSLSRLHTPPCEMSSHDPELASEDVTLPIQYGARRGSELLMNYQ